MDPLIKSQLLYQLSYAPIELTNPQVREGRHVAKPRKAVQRNSDPVAARVFAPAEMWSPAQFLSLSTSLFFPIHGIMARNFAPTSSIGCALARARNALNDVWLTLFSSIQSRVNRPD